MVQPAARWWTKRLASAVNCSCKTPTQLSACHQEVEWPKLAVTFRIELVTASGYPINGVAGGYNGSSCVVAPIVFRRLARRRISVGVPVTPTPVKRV
jgi:hypothetical protein